MSDSYFLSESDAASVNQTEENLVMLGGRWIPVINPVSRTNLDRMAPKVTSGDYTRDNDEILSSVIQPSWIGGGEEEVIVEGADTDRYYDGDVEAMYAQQLASGQEIVTLATTSTVIPLGDLTDTTDTIVTYVADGLLLKSITAGDALSSSLGTLPGTPVSDALEWNGQLWIPCGGSGYASYSPEAGFQTSTAILPTCFIVRDDKLVAMDTARYLRRTQDGVTWTAQGPRLRTPQGHHPKGMFIVEDRSGEPAVHVVTDRDVWVWYETADRLVLTSVVFPTHPDMGLAAANWRGLGYISVAVGMFEYSGPGGTISAVGLDRDAGLPARLRGRIIDLEPEYNGLYAYVEGRSFVSTSVTETLTQEVGTYYDDPAYLAKGSVNASIHVSTGAGWHKKWESSGTGTPTRMRVSQARSTYRLYWGFGSTLYWINLRRGFHTPKQGRRAGEDRFRPFSTLTTGRYDGGMLGYAKLGSHVQIGADYASATTARVDVYYMTDSFPDPSQRRFLGSATHQGINILPFGVNDFGFSEGESFQWIQFVLEFWNVGATESAILDNFGFYFTKLPNANQRSFAITVPNHFDENIVGMGRWELDRFLDSLTTSNQFYELLIPGPHDTVGQAVRYRVRVSQLQGTADASQDDKGSRIINIVEVRLPEDTFTTPEQGA